MLVSVIIPIFNAEKHLLDCINSVITQSHQPIEIICVDDGSTDQSVQLVESLINKNTTVTIRLIKCVHSGASKARNAGVLAAKGEYIQFLDADDIILEKKIEKQIQLAELNNKPDLIIGSYIKVNNQGSLIKQRQYNEICVNNLWPQLMRTDLGNTCSNLFHKRLFENGLIWNENFESSQEYELMFKILKSKSSVLFDDSMNTKIRVTNSHSISSTNLRSRVEQYLDLRKEIFAYLKNENPQLINLMVIESLLSSIKMVYRHNPERARIEIDSIPSEYYQIYFESKKKTGIGFINWIIGAKKTLGIQFYLSKLLRTLLHNPENESSS
jgi:glycosyltransferase involved in cell wall biosynthesis